MDYQSTSPSRRQIPDNTPIIVGAGQHVERFGKKTTTPYPSPMALAAVAAQTAINDTGRKQISSEIDTIAVVKLFSDSSPAWNCPFGRSDNPPESIAQRIGASPKDRIYSQVGGTQPLDLLLEMSHAIAKGEREVVLLAGAEAIGYQRLATRENTQIDWNEEFDDTALEDRGHGSLPVSEQEITNGLLLPVYYYSLIENYQAHTLGHDERDHLRYMAKLFSPFSHIAADNPHAQFPQAHSADALMMPSKDNYILTEPYTKHFISQDAVNQSAALLLTSVGKAKELGIDSSQWVFLNGFAQGSDHYLSQRRDPGKSEVMATVLNKTLEMAESSIDDIEFLDVYSCFPCAVTAAKKALGIKNGSRDLTITGGLPYFGGPGNNYSMHAVAQMTQQLRLKPSSRGMVTANGGMLSKHAAVVLSCQSGRSGALDWNTSQLEPYDADPLQMIEAAKSPDSGKIISFTIAYGKKTASKSFVLAETAQGHRFVAYNEEPHIIAEVENIPPIGRQIAVTSQAGKNQFTFSSG